MELYSLVWWGYIIAGLGLFLFGMTFFGDSLRKLAGNKLKTIIDKCTSNTFKGILVGMLVTAVFQSSMATTLLSIGLISAGLMSLPQAIGIIMGANIGTTATAFIIGLNLTAYAPFFVLAGVILIVFFPKQKIKQIGEVALSFGLLFFGLSLMESCLKLLAQEPVFVNIVTGVGDKPFLGMLVGALGTTVLQSSSAFIGVIQSIYNSTAASGATIKMMIPLLFGSNIGTTISCVIASAAGKTVNAKRATTIHVAFNVIGTIIFMLLLTPYTHLVELLSSWLNLDPKMQIAVTHILFNVLTTIILYPCVPLLVKGVKLLIPEKKGKNEISFDLSVLDHNVMEISPSTALTIAREQTVIMGNYACQSVELVVSFFNEKDDEKKETVLKIEEAIDMFNEKLTDFFHRLGSVELSANEMKTYCEILKTFRDIERISDHCENLIEYFDEYYKSNEVIHSSAKEEILTMLTIVEDMITNSIDFFKNHDYSLVNRVETLEMSLDNMNKTARNNHVERLASNQDVGNKYITVVFADITANIERIGDHCTNIIENVLENGKAKDIL